MKSIKNNLSFQHIMCAQVFVMNGDLQQYLPVDLVLSRTYTILSFLVRERFVELYLPIGLPNETMNDACVLVQSVIRMKLAAKKALLKAQNKQLGIASPMATPGTPMTPATPATPAVVQTPAQQPKPAEEKKDN